MSRRLTSRHESLKHESLKKEIKKQPHLIGLCEVIFVAEEMEIYSDGGRLKAPDLIFQGRFDGEAKQNGLYWILVEVKSTRTRDNADYAVKQLTNGKRYLQDYLHIDAGSIRTMFAYGEKDDTITCEEVKIK